MCRIIKFMIFTFLTCVVYTNFIGSYVQGSEGNSQIADLKVSANSLEQRLKQTLRTLDIHVAELTGFPISNEDEKAPIMSPRAELDIKNIAGGKKTLLNEIKNQLVPVLNDLNNHLIVLERYNESINIYSPSMYVFHEHQAAKKSFPIGVDSNRICEATFINSTSRTKSKNTVPTSCKDIQENGNNISGIYQIQPKKSEKPIIVLCDMETHGGGWTHIQKRFDGSQDFYLDWREYKFGFGDLQGEFWLGLENIYKLTGLEVTELLIELVDKDNKKGYAHYKAFGIGPETDGYPLNVLRGYSGDAGDEFTYHLGYKFTTKDFDRDSHKDNCAQLASGAWWYKDCYRSNLNGKYLNANLPAAYKDKGLHWYGFRTLEYSLSKSRMMVRPAEE